MTSVITFDKEQREWKKPTDLIWIANKGAGERYVTEKGLTGEKTAFSHFSFLAKSCPLVFSLTFSVSVHMAHVYWKSTNCIIAPTHFFLTLPHSSIFQLVTAPFSSFDFLSLSTPPPLNSSTPRLVTSMDLIAAFCKGMGLPW